MPDYQGLGIGHVFSTAIADLYKKKGFRFVITSSTKALFKQRSADKRWAVTAKKRQMQNSGELVKTSTKNKLTYSYEYIGDK